MVNPEGIEDYEENQLWEQEGCILSRKVIHDRAARAAAENARRALKQQGIHVTFAESRKQRLLKKIGSSHAKR